MCKRDVMQIIQSKYWCVFLFSLFIYSSVSYANDEFPGRALYPAVPYIEINDLADKFNDYQIVDVRSSYEFKILHIKDAINIPLTSKNFINEVQKLRDSDTRPIAIYCNGKTCMKSYNAVNQCRKNKISDVIAYDRGIMDWAQAFPEKAVLLDKTPVDTRMLISKDDFRKHLLEPEKFELDIAETEPMVLDIRDRNQREALSLFIGIENHVDINDQVAFNQYIEQSNRENKPLYIYDTSGKRTRWLQYLLEKNNAQSYYFMAGGTHEYFKRIRAQYTNK